MNIHYGTRDISVWELKRTQLLPRDKRILYDRPLADLQLQ